MPDCYGAGYLLDIATEPDTFLDIDDDPPRLCRMLDELMRLRDLVQREALRDGKARPARLQRAVDRAARFHLSFNGDVVAADEEEPRVDEHQLPDGDLDHGSVGGVGCDRPALPQELDVGFNVRAEGHFDD